MISGTTCMSETKPFRWSNTIRDYRSYPKAIWVFQVLKFENFFKALKNCCFSEGASIHQKGFIKLQFSNNICRSQWIKIEYETYFSKLQTHSFRLWAPEENLVWNSVSQCEHESLHKQIFHERISEPMAGTHNTVKFLNVTCVWKYIYDIILSAEE